MPSASIVLRVGSRESAPETSLKDRAAEKQARKKGSHTMQSIGVYAKDDNNKGELIDGGGGVWYEQDVTDDEAEAVNEAEDFADSEEGGDEEEQKATEGSDTD